MSIYAPYIQDTVPAFLKDGEAKITYIDNPAVGDFYDGIKIRIIETIRENTFPEINCDKSSIKSNEDGTKTITCQLPKNTVNDWQFYKFQIAYHYNNSTSLDQITWSSIALGRCVTKLSSLDLTYNNSQLIVSARLAAISELIYSYYFVLKDNNKEFTTETFYASSKNQSINNDFVVGTYDILDTGIIEAKVVITTFNGYVEESDFVPTSLGSGTTPVSIIAEVSNDIETGGVEIKVTTTAGIKKYQILRTTDKQKYEIVATIIPNSTDTKYLDKSVEHGQIYYYVLREDNGSGYSDLSSITANSTIVPYFEDIFLVGGSKQLCIRFNPQVSNFKNIVLESKQETIGGKYPFFFRNGDTQYKEISISGLISYWMDEKEMFMTDRELGLDSNVDMKRTSTVNNFKNNTTITSSSSKIRTTNLVDYNIAAERKFKLAVLDWLNDGKPKLFKSPTEGNYIVRLMNVSLTPEDKLGRMLHSFQATGYECMDCTIENMQNNGILSSFAI